MSNTFKRTKILATLGPDTSNAEMIEKLAMAGANGFRLNFSHGSHEEKSEQIGLIRQMTAKTGKIVSVLQDLQGPKIRLGMIKDNRLEVKAGDILTLDFALAEHQGDLVVPVQYNLAEKVKVGEVAYIFDGKIKTTVIEISSNTAIRVRIENDGVLMSKKGFNLPDTDFGGDILTPKDLADIEFGATCDLDYVALSFIQSAEDINNLRRILNGYGSKAKIIAKVETKASIVDETLEEIVKVSDGVMVARGDLAVEAGAEIVPIVQRRIISLCRKYGKLSIVATQMMASMVDAPEPTRAEASDVSNAVVQGADVVMLSDETACGHYPVETVAAMKKVIVYTQEHEPVACLKDGVADSDNRLDAISIAAVSLARKLNAAAIFVNTTTGATVESIVAHRPNLPVFSATSDIRVAQQLALRYADRSYNASDALTLAGELKNQGLFGNESVDIVVVSGKNSDRSDTIEIRTI